jgi:hypothetical protein
VVIDAGPKNTTNEDALPSEGRSLLTKPLTEPTLLEMSDYGVNREGSKRRYSRNVMYVGEPFAISSNAARCLVRELRAE